MTDYKALCSELEQQLSSWYGLIIASGVGGVSLEHVHQLLNRTRAALAESAAVDGTQ